jgi:DNA-binding NtrC family response regulator
LALSEEQPTTTLEGFIESFTAKPSRKNSGLETTSKGILVLEEITSLTLSAVPTGTVDLLTITL